MGMAAGLASSDDSRAPLAREQRLVVGPRLGECALEQ